MTGSPYSGQRKLRYALIGVVVVLIAAAGVVTLEYNAAPKVNPQIRISSVWSDRVDAAAGQVIYILGLNASNSGSQAWHFNPSLLQLVSNNSHGYSADSSYNATALIQESNVAPSGNIEGQVAFAMPVDEVPSELRYNDQSTGVSLEVGSIPTVSAQASRFGPNACLTINGNPASTCTGNAWTVSNVTGPDRWVASIISNGWVGNNSLVFFSGQIVELNLWFEYLKQPVDPASIRVQSVTSDDGLSVVGVQPPLPAAISGWGATADLVVLLKAPANGYSGNIHLSVQFAS